MQPKTYGKPEPGVIDESMISMAIQEQNALAKERDEIIPSPALKFSELPKLVLSFKCTCRDCQAAGSELK